MPTRLGWRLLASGLIGAFVWVTYGISVAPRSAGAPGAGPEPRSGKKPEWQKSTSCASTACHGGNLGATPKDGEYTFWASRDRHANAYTVLLEPRSRTIERKLRGAKGRPETDPLCLRCHTTQAELFDTDKADAESRECSQPAVTLLEGVGCDRCHSTRPGAGWITRHYGRDWKGLTDAEKRATGFRPLADLVGQARLCAECHVGTRAADVDHDLIAAGHPALKFELSAFRAIMPPHWDERTKRERQPDREARTWAIGQFVSAEYAFDLLAARAAKESKRPWPEFAEYDCYSCHQPLRASPGKPRHLVPGTFPWGTWYNAALPDAASTYLAKDRDRVMSQIQAFQATMGKPEPDRATLAKQAATIAADVRAHADQMQRSDPLTEAQVRRRFMALTDRPVLDWDSATQRYLAIAALYHAMTDMDAEHAGAETAASLRRLKRQLGFPLDRDAPANFDASTFSRELKELHRRLEPSESTP